LRPLGNAVCGLPVPQLDARCGQNGLAGPWAQLLLLSHKTQFNAVKEYAFNRYLVQGVFLSVEKR